MIAIPVIVEFGWKHKVWLMPSLEEALAAWLAGKGPYTSLHEGEVIEVEPPEWYSAMENEFGCTRLIYAHVHMDEDTYLVLDGESYGHPEYVHLEVVPEDAVIH
jgi:hypothetical protein